MLLALASDALAERIAQLKITGNRYVSEQKIRRVIRLQVGDEFSERAVTESLRRLWGTKEFSEIRAEREYDRGDLVLTIELVEYPKVARVRFEGNRHVDEDDLLEVAHATSGGFVRPSLLRGDAAAIVDTYKEKGYYRVAVTSEIKQEKLEKSDRVGPVLVYTIDEGEKVSVKHIDFFGNRAVDSDDLRDAMETDENGLLGGGEFKPSVFEEDDAKILELYRSRGFLDAEILNKEMFFSEDGKDLDLFITVREGQRYYVGDVTWAGNDLLPDPAIAGAISFHKGDVFNDTELGEIQFRLSELYWDRGYIYNSISPLKNVKGDAIDLSFDITEGQPAHVHEISISGNTKTAEHVIRRELRIHPGDVFNRPRLVRSIREVFNLGFFNGPAQVTTPRANEEGDINIDLRVEEKQTGQVRLGAGFSALNSISGFIGLADNNFLGKGQQVSLDWEFSRFRQNVDLRFTEPWLMGTPTNLSVNVFNRVQNQVRQQFYNDRRLGFSVRVGRPFPWFDYTSIFWRYGLESIELSDFALGYTGPLLSIDWPQSTSTTAVTLVRNSTDNPFRPSTGTNASVTAEFNGGAVLGGDVGFMRYQASFAWYERIFKQVALSFKYELGVLDGYESPSQVPDYELFRLGGNRLYGVRGYDFYEIVPTGNPPFLGGRFMHTMTYQVTVPLAQTVFALAFLDAGNTWNSFRGADPFEYKKGAGLGIRLELPALGTVGFDYGYGYDKPGGGAWEPHLSLGAGF